MIRIHACLNLVRVCSFELFEFKYNPFNLNG